MLLRISGRTVGRLCLPFIACAIVATITACGGGGVRTTPIAGATATPAPGPGASGVFGSAGQATTTGALGTPTALPTTASGTYTLAQLAANLDASQTPPPGTPVGTIGVISSVGSNSIVLQQVPALASPDPVTNPTGFQQNIALIGDFSSPLTVTVDPTTIFSGVAGFAGLANGQLIIAAGKPALGALAAQEIALVATPSTNTASSARNVPARVAVAAPASRRSTASLGEVVNEAFTRTASLGPAEKVDLPISNQSYPITCQTLLGKANGTGSLSLAVSTQLIASSGQVVANFPYDVTYNPNPPQFTQANGTFGGPGFVADWLNFEPQSGTDAAPTMDLTVGLALGFKVNLNNTCPGAIASIELGSATLGYAIESSTTAPMPGPSQSVDLVAQSCIGLNEPLNINLFAGANGFPNLNPFGNLAATNLQFCDVPHVSGNVVTGAVDNLIGATINNDSVTFDPSKTGASSVFSFGTFTPTASPLSFTIDTMTYHPQYQDKYEFQFTVLGNNVLSSYPLGGFQGPFNNLQSGNPSVTIAASTSGMCATVTSGNAFLGNGSMCAPIGAIDFEFCRSTSTPIGQCPSEASGTSGTVQITEPGYLGTFTVVDNQASGVLGNGCSAGPTQTYPVTTAPRTASGPQATFTISIGAQALQNSDTGCNVYIQDASLHTIEISLQMLSRQQ
jgi:hypothetical protein